MQYLTKIDKNILKWAYQRPFKNSFSIKALIFMGDGPFWMIIIFVAALAGQLLNNKMLSQLPILLISGFIISNIGFILCKTYVKRRRPYANLELQQDLNIKIQNRDPGHASKEFESFPSGHVLWTTLCVSLIYFQFGYMALLLFGWMIPSMMFLRPHLGVHYPSDVLAGLVMAGISITIILLFIPGFLEYTDALKDTAGYPFGYWILISLFLIIGFKSWLKRV